MDCPSEVSGPAHVAPNTTIEIPAVESFTNAGLRLDAFDLGDTSEWMDDFWYLQEIPPLDFTA